MGISFSHVDLYSEMFRAVVETAASVVDHLKRESRHGCVLTVRTKDYGNV